MGRKCLGLFLLMGTVSSWAFASDDSLRKRMRPDSSMDCVLREANQRVQLLEDVLTEEEPPLLNEKKRDSDAELPTVGKMKKITVLEDKSSLYLKNGVAFYKDNGHPNAWGQRYFENIQGTYRGDLVAKFLTEFHEHKPIRGMDEYIDLCKAIALIPDINFSHISYEFGRICRVREKYYRNSYEEIMMSLTHLSEERLSTTVETIVRILHIEDHESFSQDLRHLLCSFNELSLQALCKLPEAIFRIQNQATVPMQIALNARKKGTQSFLQERYKWLADAVLLADRVAAIEEAQQFVIPLPDSPDPEALSDSFADDLLEELNKLSLGEKRENFRNH